MQLAGWEVLKDWDALNSFLPGLCNNTRQGPHIVRLAIQEICAA